MDSRADHVVRNAHLRDREPLVEVVVSGGTVIHNDPAADVDASKEIDADARLMSPRAG